MTEEEKTPETPKERKAQLEPGQKLAIMIGAGALILLIAMASIIAVIVAQNHPIKPAEPDAPSSPLIPVNPTTPTAPTYQTIEYSYDDEYIPGASYDVFIDGETLELLVTVERSCSALECENSTEDYDVFLTDEEYNLIARALREKLGSIYGITNSVANNSQKREIINQITLGVLSIAKDDEIDCLKSDSFCNMDWDANQDGVVTARELGNGYLQDYLEGDGEQ